MNKRVVLVNNCYPFYSTGKIVYNIREGLIKKGYTVGVAYAWEDKGAKSESENIYRYGVTIDKYISAFLTRITGNHLGYAFLSTARLILFLKRTKPDVMHIHCANCYSCNHYWLFSWCKKKGIKVIVTEHAEYYYTGNCSYVYDCEKWKQGCEHCPNKRAAVKSLVFDMTKRHWRMMKKAFSGWEKRMVITCVSPWIEKRSLQSNITKHNRHVCVENGVNTDVFRFVDPNEITRETKSYFDGNTVLFVAPKYIDGVKGGSHLFELAKRLSEVRFVVVGVEKIEGAPENIVFKAHTTNQSELAQFYSCAKVVLLTSKRETFSLVTAESLCCGTPVVGFKCGGPESIALQEYSEFVDYGNIDELETVLKKWLRLPESNKKSISAIAGKRYSDRRMVREYLKVYEELLS